MMSRRLLIVFVAVSLGILWPSSSLFAEECSRNGKFYEANGYVVTKIAVEAPLDLAYELREFAAGKGLMLRARDPQSGGNNGRFEYLHFLQSASDIGMSLSSGYSLSVAVVVPILHTCDETTKTLEVTYRVYHVGTPVNASGMNYALQSPPVQIRNEKLSQILLIAPGVGYDAARHFFAGGAMALHSEIKRQVYDFSVVGYGSSSSIQLQANLSGMKQWSTGPVRHADWGLTYVDSDLPSGPYAISEKQLSVRVAGIGRTNDSSGLNLHFGGSLAGGNQRSTGAASVQPSIGVLRSPVGSLKLYLGSSWSHGATSVTASYGAQLGSAQSAVQLDFIKQVVNASIATHFLPISHHPLAVDENFRAGWLTSNGTIPLAERFFGGNIPSPFIPGDAWVIQSNPILRSFPAHNFTMSDGPFGGTSFFSVNTNLSYAVWARPLVPKQVAAEIKPLLQGQLKTFKNVTADFYVADGEPYKALEAALSSHAASLAKLRDRLRAIKDKPGASADLSGAVTDTLGDLESVDDQIELLGKRNASADALAPTFQLVVGEGPWKGNLSDLADDLSGVSDELKSTDDDDRSYITGVLKEVQMLRESALAQFKAIDRSPAEAKADESLRFPNHVMSELLDAVNLYSISPTLLFDVARLGPHRSIGRTGAKYGIGPAIRFGLINVDFTAGYSFNVQESAGEPRGAAVVGLTFQNLF